MCLGTQTPDAGVASCKFLGNSDQPYSSCDGKQQLYADDANTPDRQCNCSHSADAACYPAGASPSSEDRWPDCCGHVDDAAA